MPEWRASDGAQIPGSIRAAGVTAARRSGGIGNGLRLGHGESPGLVLAGYSTQPWTTHATVSISCCRS